MERFILGRDHQRIFLRSETSEEFVKFFSAFLPPEPPTPLSPRGLGTKKDGSGDIM